MSGGRLLPTERKSAPPDAASISMARKSEPPAPSSTKTAIGSMRPSVTTGVHEKWPVRGSMEAPSGGSTSE